MKQISKSFQSFLFNKIFPRGRQYIHDDFIDDTVNKTFISARKIKVSFSKNNSDTVVILTHPYVASAKQFYYKSGHIDLYQNLGARVVTFDFNGFGESPLSDFHFENDIKEVFTWVSETMKPQKCILHGISFGASQLIRAGADPIYNNCFFIIENCLDKGIHYFKKRNRSVYRFLQVLYFFTPRLKEKDDFVKGIQKCQNMSEFLFIYGKNDELTTSEMGIKLYKNCPRPSRFIEIPGGHLEGIQLGEEYNQIIEEFLKN